MTVTIDDPIPMLLWCPECGERHIDVGEFATKVHHTHSCQHCGHVWRPAIVPTCGVQFLPGFKNKDICVICDRQAGSTQDRCGVEDGIPLGPVEPCGDCGRMACPDCTHERDCCFAESEEHEDDQNWAPPGWTVTSIDPKDGRITYTKIIRTKQTMETICHDRSRSDRR